MNDASDAGDLAGLTAGELRGEKSLETFTTDLNNLEAEPDATTLGSGGGETSLGKRSRAEVTTGSEKCTCVCLKYVAMKYVG